MAQEIRNFSIIAHIDHGKSTLADRLMEVTNTVSQREMKEQLLDSMDLEREKGITIKLQPVRMKYELGDIEYQLNLIDTPGHVDFQYEVSRSLQAVEGALLLVDATQGVQAQTIANLHLAIEQGLEIIPVINKIDLPAADVLKVEQEIINLIGGSSDDILKVSAKTGEGVKKILERIIEVIPRPRPTSVADRGLRALVFDSVYDDFKGVVAYVRVVDGSITTRDQLMFVGTKTQDRAVEVGTFNPNWQPGTLLQAGEIGYIATGLKDVRQARVGDTISLAKQPTEALPGFAIPQPKVFAGIFPSSGDAFPDLRDAMNELVLNDASLNIKPEQSDALGQGFRCGFLGMLHLEIIQERLRREYDLDLVITTPSVIYKIITKSGAELTVETPVQFPDPSHIEEVREQYATCIILTPISYLGAVFDLLQDRESTLQGQDHLDADRVQLTYSLPIRELVVDLYDRLKSATSGYGSLSYEMGQWQLADVVKLSVLINHEVQEALSLIVARGKAETIGRRVVTALKDIVPKQQFAVPVQAAVGGTVVARETVSALRKDVTAKLYGGDVTRKRKLLEKQKKGKKKLAGDASIKLPPEAYLAVFKKS